MYDMMSFWWKLFIRENLMINKTIFFFFTLKIRKIRSHSQFTIHEKIHAYAAAHSIYCVRERYLWVRSLELVAESFLSFSTTGRRTQFFHLKIFSRKHNLKFPRAKNTCRKFPDIIELLLHWIGETNRPTMTKKYRDE